MKLSTVLFALSVTAGFTALKARAQDTTAPSTPTAATTTAEPARTDTEGVFKPAPAGTTDDANVTAAKAAGGKVAKATKKAAANTKKAAVKAGHAVKTASAKAARGVKNTAKHPVIAAKAAGGKISKGTKNAVANTKAAAKRHHDAQLAKGEANDAAHAPCDRDVSLKSGNAVGNPCLTSDEYAKSRGLKPKQVAKAHSAKTGKAHAKKRATH